VVEAGESDITYDYYYNESWQVLEVRKGGDGDPLEQYVWGALYIDAPVVRFLDGNVDGDLLDTQDNTDSTLYYTYDGNFNVTAVIKPDGTVAERYTYDPYGKVTFKAADWSDAASQAKSAYDNEVLYCGYRWDPESGNYIARRRYLTPPLGRWLTTDLIVYGDGMNLYAYCLSNPSRLLDPQGLFPWTKEPDNCYDGCDKIAGTYNLLTGKQIRECCYICCLKALNGVVDNTVNDAVRACWIAAAAGKSAGAPKTLPAAVAIAILCLLSVKISLRAIRRHVK
jgi:RHS repeat-associated protein